MKRSLVLVGIVAIACSRHPLEKDDGGNAGTSGGGIAGVAGRGAAGAGRGGSAVAGSGGGAGAAGAGGSGAVGGIGGAASAGIGGAASAGIGGTASASGTGGPANGGVAGGIGGIGGTSTGGIGGAANGGTGGVANGGAGAGAAGTGAAGGMAGSWCGGAAGALGACGKPVGEPCAVSAECATAQCADGVCCESACVGSCRSCNLAASVGRCMPVAAGAPDPRAMCVASLPATCGLDGRCDGSGGCRRYATGSLCAAETCISDVFTPPSVCNGVGACVAPQPRSCFPYKCNSSGICASFCTADPECTLGMCRNGTCQRPGQGAPCTDNSECASTFCAQGACCATACAGPCRSCALAGTIGVCTPIPNPDPSWNCSTGG